MWLGMIANHLERVRAGPERKHRRTLVDQLAGNHVYAEFYRKLEKDADFTERLYSEADLVKEAKSFLEKIGLKPAPRKSDASAKGKNRNDSSQDSEAGSED